MQDEWRYSTEHNCICRVVEEQTLWGAAFCRIWLPGSDAVVRVPASSLRPLSQDLAVNSDQIAYVAAAARVADALTQDVLLAPIESSVIPLPHQLRALSRATSHDRLRYLLADEVGLGKTIEAGLIVRELKLRGLAQRILVLAPRGLVTQWVAEMHTHFNEPFHLLSPGDFGAFRRFMGDGNLWRTYDQVVCPMDSVKPLEKRRGWSKEKVCGLCLRRDEGGSASRYERVVCNSRAGLSGQGSSGESRSLIFQKWYRKSHTQPFSALGKCLKCYVNPWHACGKAKQTSNASRRGTTPKVIDPWTQASGNGALDGCRMPVNAAKARKSCHVTRSRLAPSPR